MVRRLLRDEFVQDAAKTPYVDFTAERLSFDNFLKQQQN